ncbi:MAG: APC family permease [Pseudomonadota bacterium]
MAKPKAEVTLSRQLGPVAMMFTGLSIIGSGWLFAALYTAQLAGPAGILSWVIGGVVTLAIALVYAELGGMLPVGGALARIPYFSFGPLGGFMAGWLCWAAFVATAPLEVIAVLDYATNYLPWLSEIEDGERRLTFEGVLVAIAMLALFTGINLAGVKYFARANTTITFWKLLVPVVAAILLIAYGFRWENLTEFGGFAPYGATGVMSAVSSGGIMFAFYGFRSVVDMAGEARNPRRDVPLSIIGTVVFCIIFYIALQIAFIGAVPVDQLSNGWAGITETAPGGPFAAFAAILGLQWLAILLYADAIVSPAGTGLTFMASAARINYSMAKADQVPSFFGRLNRFRVPGLSLGFNFLIGIVVVLPLPGWNQLVEFISTSAVLSFAFGPVALMVLRLHVPNRSRPFRIPIAYTFTALAFILVTFIVYWTGWETNWKIMVVAAVGIVIFATVRRLKHGPIEPLHLRASAWIWPYYGGLAIMSYGGNYGGGLGLIPNGVDLLILAVFSLSVFRYAIWLRLDRTIVERLLETSRAEIESAPGAAQ